MEQVAVQLDYHAFRVADTNDAWYRANGTTAVRPLNPAARAAGSYAGSEVDFTVMWKAREDLRFQAGYSHYFAGTFLSDTGTGDAAVFGYVQATLSF